jgi:hypothetical protein
MVYSVEQQAFIDARILQMKRELLRSWWGSEIITNSQGNELPITVDSFGELHDYCDANTLGGLCDEAVSAEAERIFGAGELERQSWFDACSLIQNTIHEWLSKRESVDDFANMVRHMEAEQVECLLDDGRSDEAHGMVDDLEARVGAFHGFTSIYCDWLRRMLPPVTAAASEA